MFYWGKLNSGNDSPAQGSDVFDEVFRRTRITDVSMKEGLAGFLRATDRKVIVVTSHRRITLNLKEQIASLSSGQDHVVLVSETGTVCEWKTSAQCKIPRTFSNLTNRHIAHVACGNSHSFVLTKDGQLFTWGQNSSGQLGLGKSDEIFQSPQPLKSLCGIPLIQISAGGDHSFALSLSGAVFGWGRNSAGQLGLGDTDDRHVPVCVKSLNLKKTIFISCGEDHTAVLTKSGLMLTFGSGQYGQLGHNSLRDEHHPRVVAEFWGSKVSQIACGRHHTLALVESSNTVYSFGCGEQGQLENGQRTNQYVPLPVQLPPDCNPDQMIKKITAGGNLSVLFTSIMVSSITLRSCKGPAVLDIEMIDHWISACDSNVWRKKQREIKRIFSSASCISGSFIEKSNDKHYKTSVVTSGLDLSLTRLAFEELAKKSKVLSVIETTVEKNLLPSLSSTAAGVEALRVYLILPELLRVLNKQERGTQLTISLASAVLKLEPESMDVLTSLWTKLPYSYYRTLVKMFRSVCAHFMSLMTTKICDHWTEVKPVLEVLQKLYNINSQRNERLTEGYFLSKELHYFFNLVKIYPLKHLILKMNQLEDPWEPWLVNDGQLGILINFLKSAQQLACYPFIIDTECKCIVFHILQVQKPGPLQYYTCVNKLCVNRKTVLTDTLLFLKENRHNFSLPLEVTFSLEDGIDDGGLRLALFTLLGQEITKASSVIQASEDSGLFWFSADVSGNGFPELFYIGIICGLAFYNHAFLNIGFPVALFKKLLNRSPTFSDLEELSPVEARSLKDVLMEDEDVLEMLYLDFTVKGKELIPNGAEIPVTKANRQKYVDLYVDFVFNKSVKKQFKKFEEGFSRANPFNLWKMFKPEELRVLLYGTLKYEWEELQKGVTYELCGPSCELIQNFWTVFFELNEEEKKLFLTFVYGTDCLPIGGLSKLQLKIVRCNYNDADDRFPSAQTCYGILRLPNYSSIHILKDKLIHAITHCEVFGQM
ncbi:probable E3 ubiquitin-protein ligase HERC3 [Neoarius graeffei]|uniref:probable E3 ubiquitin-protein ligase HERC3 n=1 Tax=Neoarius graeffei TaxID=443677 RepID=UPI00298D0755|nr:probable E3 ubiquitin-protein ligase HERC3 [Neoarius graeffei]